MSLLEFVQLDQRAKDQVEPLPGGMKRRLTIARALINEPELVILDERDGPTHSAATPVGTPLPAEAPRRDADHHDLLHGRGGAAVRRPRGHGQGEDRGRGVAAPAHRPALDPGGALAGVTDAARESLNGQLEGARRSGRGAAGSVPPDTADGERTLEQVNLRKIPIESALVRRSSMEDVFLRLTVRSLVE